MRRAQGQKGRRGWDGSLVRREDGEAAGLTILHGLIVMLGGGGGWADAAVPLPPEPAARLQGAAHPDRNLPTQGMPHA